jgi:uncharacterized protein YndB with AHSA1/START domain
MGTTSYTIEPGSHALHLEREFEASAEQLLHAHTDPDLLAQWIGPRRLQTKVERLDPHDGGRWRFGQWGEDGVEHWFHGVFHGEPSVAGGITQTFEYEGTPGEVLLERLTFEERDGRTVLRATSVFTSVEARDGMVAAGMQEGVEDGYARLDELLERR